MKIERVTFRRLVSDRAGYGNRMVEATAIVEPGEDSSQVAAELRTFVYGTIAQDIADEEAREQERIRLLIEQQNRRQQEQQEIAQRRRLSRTDNIVCDELADDPGEPYVIQRCENFDYSYLTADGVFMPGEKLVLEQMTMAHFASEDDARAFWQSVVVPKGTEPQPEQ